MSGSIYGSSSYELLAVLVNTRSQASALPTLRVHGSPKSVVKQQFAPVIAQYEAELAEAQRRASETIAKIEKTSAELDAAQRTLADEYNTMRPKKEDGPAATARNPLRDLSKVRAAKTKVDDWYKEAYLDRITPIRALLKSLYEQKIADQLAILFLRGGFKDRLFAALDAIPEDNRRLWTTDVHGKSTITVPNEEPWAIWAETTHSETVGWVSKRKIDATIEFVERLDRDFPESEFPDFEPSDGSGRPGAKLRGEVHEQVRPELKTSRVRWLLHVPDDLDRNKKLVIDQQSAFDLLDITIESGGSDGKYLRKGGAVQ